MYSTKLPSVIAALARASILSRWGSPPRVTWASLSRAALRAFSGSSALTAPSVMRRCMLADAVLDNPRPLAARTNSETEPGVVVIEENRVTFALRQLEPGDGRLRQLHRGF